MVGSGDGRARLGPVDDTVEVGLGTAVFRSGTLGAVVEAAVVVVTGAVTVTGFTASGTGALTADFIATGSVTGSAPTGAGFTASDVNVEAADGTAGATRCCTGAFADPCPAVTVSEGAAVAGCFTVVTTAACSGIDEDCGSAVAVTGSTTAGAGGSTATASTTLLETGSGSIDVGRTDGPVGTGGGARCLCWSKCTATTGLFIEPPTGPPLLPSATVTGAVLSAAV